MRTSLSRLPIEGAIWHYRFRQGMHRIVVSSLRYAERSRPDSVAERRARWSASMLELKRCKQDLRVITSRGLC